MERVTFHSPESGFCVLRVTVRGQRDLVTVAGSAAAVHPGEYLKSTGHWINDATYGRQFRAAELRIVPPSTLEGVPGGGRTLGHPALPDARAQSFVYCGHARILDTAFTVPGTNFRFGLDGILGLIPGIGDATGDALSIYLIAAAARLGFPVNTLLRMVGNVTVETIVGVIPIIGDIFDFAWKANRRNMALLRAYEGQPGPRERSPSQILRLFLVPMIVVVFGLVALPILALWLIFRLF